MAKEVAQQFSTDDKPRFVAGSMGPSTKLPSLGHISFGDMVEAYEEQAAALIEGGVDILLVETCQDLLQAKIATIGVLEAMRKAGRRLPVTVQVTLQESGTMLLGTEIGAALTALEPFGVDVIGLNCATGPKEMNDSVRYLCLNSTKHVSVLPNAGLPLPKAAWPYSNLILRNWPSITSILSRTTECVSWAAAAEPLPNT